MNARPNIKDRAQEQASAMTDEQQASVRMLANDLHRLNQSVMNAVEAGMSVELIRSARQFGDLLTPVILANQR